MTRHTLMGCAQAHGLATWPRWLQVGCWLVYLVYQPWDHGLRLRPTTAWTVACLLAED